MSGLHADPMEQKIPFITQAQQFSKGGMSELCRRFGISRKTGYKWRQRYRQQGGLAALQEQSRRPLRSLRRTQGPLADRILELRQPDGWGARKIAYLLWQEGWRVSIATVHRILRRHDQVHRTDRSTAASSRFE